MKKRIILLLAALIPLFCSCNDREFINEFTRDRTVRLEIGGEKVFVYEPLHCQLSYNEQRGEFRSHTDTMLDYFVVRLDNVPFIVGQKTQATVSWSTPEGEKTKEKITLEAVALKGDVLWLCDAGHQTAAVVRLLK